MLLRLASMENSNPSTPSLSKNLPRETIEEELEDIDPAIIFDLINRASDSPRPESEDLVDCIDLTANSELNFDVVDQTKNVDQRIQNEYPCRRKEAESRPQINAQFISYDEMVENSQSQQITRKEIEDGDDDIWLNLYDAFLANLIPKQYKPSTSSSLKDCQRCWVIEALAEHTEADISVLDDFMSRVSDSPEGFWARERLALWHLENLFGVPELNVVDLTCPKFDVSERAQDVHRHILQLIEKSNTRISMMESFKLDVHRFVLEKRACLPKCALQQMREAIVEGHYPIQRKQSGPDREIQKENGCPVHSGCPNAATGAVDVEIEAPRLNLAQLVPENAENSFRDNLHANFSNYSSNEMMKAVQKQWQSLDGKGKCFDGARSCEHSINTEARRKNEISSLLPPENMNVHEGSPDIVLISTKRKMSNCSIEQVGCLDSDIYPNVKKLKDLGEPKCMARNSDPLLVTEPVKEPIDSHYLNNSDKEMTSAAERSNKDSKIADWTESNLCIMCNRGGELINCCASSCPIAVHASCLGSSVSFDDTGNYCCPFCSLSQATTAYKEIKKRLSSAKEKAALAKNVFLRFVHLLNLHQQKQPYEILPTETLSQSRIIAETNFLDETHHSRQTNNIDKGQLFPTSEYQREEVAAECCNPLNRGVSSSVISERTDASLPKGCTKQNSNLEPLEPYSRKIGRSDISFNNEVCCTGDMDDQNQSLVTSIEGMQRCCPRCDTSNSECLEYSAAETGNAVQDQQTAKSQQGTLSQHNVNVTETSTLSSLVDTVAISNSLEHVNVGKEKAGLQEHTVNSPQGISFPMNVNSDKIFPSPSYTDTVLTNKHHSEKRTENTVLRRQLIISPDGRCSIHGKETAEIEEDACISLELKSSPKFSSSKRKRNRWTFEEEEKLKEGVDRFAISDDKNIPWQRILEHGRGVFLKCRNANALRDKWKTLSVLFQSRGINPGAVSSNKQEKKTDTVVPCNTTTRAQSRSSLITTREPTHSS